MRGNHLGPRQSGPPLNDRDRCVPSRHTCSSVALLRNARLRHIQERSRVADALKQRLCSEGTILAGSIRQCLVNPGHQPRSARYSQHQPDAVIGHSALSIAWPVTAPLHLDARSVIQRGANIFTAACCSPRRSAAFGAKRESEVASERTKRFLFSTQNRSLFDQLPASGVVIPQP